QRRLESSSKNPTPTATPFRSCSHQRRTKFMPCVSQNTRGPEWRKRREHRQIWIVWVCDLGLRETQHAWETKEKSTDLHGPYCATSHILMDQISCHLIVFSCRNFWLNSIFQGAL